MFEFTPTEEQQALRELAREFIAQEVTPIVRERERISNPTERFPWDIVVKGSQLGLRTLAVPKEDGGAGADMLTMCLVLEELAAGDIGIATIFDQAWRCSLMFYRICTPDQIERHVKPFIGDDRALLAIAGTEAQAGSDTWLPYDEPSAGVQTFAERHDGHYVVNGNKQFISVGSEASLYVILARTDREKRYSEGGLSAFIVPRSTPGFRIGKIYDKIGQRLINNAELILENCRIPAEDRLGEEGQFYPALQRFMRGSNATAAAISLGIGRAAFETAVSWSNQRVQGGKPIIDHQAIQVMLADMAIKLETARLVTLKAAWAADHQEPFDPRLASMSKAYASEAMFDVCRMAMEIHGGYGIMKDLMLEKYLRDAVTMLHSDGTNQVHRFRIVRWIKQGIL